MPPAIPAAAESRWDGERPTLPQAHRPREGVLRQGSSHRGLLLCRGDPPHPGEVTAAPPGTPSPAQRGVSPPPPLRGGVTTDPPPSSRGGAALRRWGVSIRRAPPRLHPPRRGQRREGPGSAAARRGLSGTFRRPGPAPGGTRHWGGGGETTGTRDTQRAAPAPP